jgi:hypothetical protein
VETSDESPEDPENPKCEKCGQAFAARTVKVKEAKPTYLERQLKGSKVRFRWWAHNMGADLRGLGLILLAVLTYVCWLELPEYTFGDAWRNLLHHPKMGWAPVVGILADGLLWAGGCYLIGLKLFSRQVIEWDGSVVSISTEPVPSPVQRVPRPELKQLFVTPDGLLHCLTGADERVALSKGTPQSMRYVEQQLQEAFQVVDPEGDLQTTSTEVVTRWCPHCGFAVTLEGDEGQTTKVASKPAGVFQVIDRNLELSWSWKGREVFIYALVVAVWDALSVASFAKLRFWAVLYPHVWVGVALTYYILCRVLNRTCIQCDGKTLRVSCRPLAWLAFEKEVACSDIRQCYVLRHETGKEPFYSWECELSGDRHVTLIKREYQAERLRYAEQELEKCLKLAGKF